MYPTGLLPHHRFSAWKFGLFGALLLAFFLFAQAAPAAPTTAGQAQIIVQHWLARDAAPLGAVLAQRVAGATPYGSAAVPLYYAVALSPAGYVIVAGDDRLEPIIAFVPRGSYNPSPAHPLGALVSRDLPNRLARVQTMGAATSPAEVRHAVTRAQQKWTALLAANEHVNGLRHSVAQRPARRSAPSDHVEPGDGDEDGALSPVTITLRRRMRPATPIMMSAAAWPPPWRNLCATGNIPPPAWARPLSHHHQRRCRHRAVARRRRERRRPTSGRTCRSAREQHRRRRSARRSARSVRMPAFR